MKKLLLFFVTMILPIAACADAVEIDGIYYNLIKKSDFCIAEITRNPQEYQGCINIPESVSYDGVNYGVTSIGNFAFSACSNLTSVTIPSSVTSIGDYAFSHSTRLLSIKIPNSVTSIGERAFASSSGLVSVIMGNGVTNIDYGAFEDCYSLTSVHISDLEAWCNISFSTSTSNPLQYAHHLYLNGKEINDLVIPNNVTSIRNSAFIDCYNLTSVTIPNSVTSIGNCAFSGCCNLTSVAIPNSVTMLGIYAFQGCSGLTSVIIGNGVDSIGEWAFGNCSGLSSVTIGNGITSIGNAAFTGCSSLISVTIPNSVIEIKDYAFYDCSGLTSVKIGNGIQEIRISAFAYCPKLTDVYCYAEQVPQADVSAFEKSYVEYATLHVPESAIAAYETTKPWNMFKNTIMIMPFYELTYLVDGEEYKSYDIEYGSAITPEPIPTKDGYTFSGWSEIPETMPAHDVTVTGSFSINSYKLTYTVDSEVYKSYDIKYGTLITPEAEPAKEGYTFSGWSEIPETMPAHDVTVTGTFSINKYKLTYVVDGVEYKSYNIEYGATLTPEAEPTKEGYTFSGWSEIPATMPNHDVTVTGTFAINSYKLTYIVDGEVYKSYDIEYGATITPEAEPTKEGYTFSGWSEIPATMPAHDVTVTGTFSINKYKLTYVVDGVEYKSYDIEYGATITPEAEPTKEGYTFSGWSEIPETMPAHDVTVIGTFSINSYKLIYTVDGVEYKSYDIEYGATITPEAEPTKEGYTFSGWSTIPETMPAHDVTVTGLFSINSYKLTYTVNGEVYKTYDVEYGTAITPETEPSKEGYTFSGWSTIPEAMPAHDVTVTGTFKVNKYKVNYFVDNNSYFTDMVEYGATITPPTVPEREGYDFAWGYIPDTMPAYDISIYGQYTVKTGIMTTTKEHPVDIYNLQGNKMRSRAATLEGLVKGIYIVNGRKIVVK